MELVRISFGTFSLKTTREWQFFPIESFILARHDARVGLLKISPAADAPPASPNAENLFRIAEKLVAPTALSAPFDVRLPQSSDPLFGAASYKIQSKQQDFFTRAWFLARNRHVTFATYGCPWAVYQSDAAQREIYQCEQMMLSIRHEASSGSS